MRLIQSLASKELVRNLPKLKFDQHFYDACKMGKQALASHKAKNIVSTTRCLELLHMDLFGPSTVRSYGGNRYTLFIVDDYSRYTWTRFLKDKTEAFDQFEIFSGKNQNQLGCSIVSIRTDHGREFDNEVQFGCRVTFFEHDSEITKDGKVIGRGIRKKGLYVMKLGNKPKEKICLATIDKNSTLWHRRLGHANMHLIQSLASMELVRNLPKLKFDQHFCDACKIRKQAHANHKAKNSLND
ncbi:retrovirus-related pol polyprotein from transposon TNT 1-94 [Tanacetum coccineum]